MVLSSLNFLSNNKLICDASLGGKLSHRQFFLPYTEVTRQKRRIILGVGWLTKKDRIKGKLAVECGGVPSWKDKLCGCASFAENHLAHL